MTSSLKESLLLPRSYNSQYLLLYAYKVILCSCCKLQDDLLGGIWNIICFDGDGIGAVEGAMDDNGDGVDDNDIDGDDG